MSWLDSKIVRVLLPLLLSASTVLALGSYFETSDDEHFVLLFSGATAAAPVASLPLYFHGLSHGLAAAYTAVPAVPWYGLLLAGLLAGATVLFFLVLSKLLRPLGRPAVVAGALVLFFLVAWLEHWLWFSHVRVAALLALSGLLTLALAPIRSGRWPLGLAAVLLGCLLRPSAAGLGLLVATPAAGWLAWGLGRSGKLALRPVGAAWAVWLAVQGGLILTATPADQQHRTLDARLALVLDYQLLRPAPRTTVDSMTVVAVNNWLFSADTLINTSALHQIYHFDEAYFLASTLPAKLTERLVLVARDYFPLLLALAVAAGYAWRLPHQDRHWFWLTQGYFMALLLLLAGVLKLPPRLALPLFDGWVLASLAALLGPAARRSASAAGANYGIGEGRERRLQQALAGLMVLATTLYVAKTAHRTQVLRAECQAHSQALQQLTRDRLDRKKNVVRSLGQSLPPEPLVLGGADDLFKSLSPFRRYTLGPGPVLLLTGWPAHAAGPRGQWQELSGRQPVLAGTRELAQQPLGRGPRWLLSAEVAPVLARLLGGGPTFRPWLVAPEMSLDRNSGLNWYTVKPRPAH